MFMHEAEPAQVLKSIIQEDPQFKHELKTAALEVEEIRKWTGALMKEIGQISDRLAEMFTFIDVFPLRLQQLSGLSGTGLVDSAALLPAFKIFFNVLHSSIACQDRYLKLLRRDMEVNFVVLIGEECDRICELKSAFEKSEEKYETFFCRFASQSRSKEAPPSQGNSSAAASVGNSSSIVQGNAAAAGIGEDLLQLLQLRSQYYVDCYGLYAGICKFKQSSCCVLFSQLHWLSRSFGQFSAELAGIGEQILQIRHQLSQKTQHLLRGKDEAFREMERQKRFFLKALRSSISSLNKICAFNNLEAFRVEKSQVMFVKQSKNWKRSFVRLQNGYLTVVCLGNRSCYSSSAAVPTIPASQPPGTSSVIGMVTNSSSSNNGIGTNSSSSASKACVIPILLAEVRFGAASAAVGERRNCFELITPQQTMLFQAETEEMMMDWIQCIDVAKQDAIKFNHNGIDEGGEVANCNSAITNQKFPLNSSGKQSFEEQKEQISSFFPSDETIYACFNVGLQRQVLLLGRAFLSEKRLHYAVGMFLEQEEENEFEFKFESSGSSSSSSSSNHHHIQVAFESISRMEIEHYDLYDLVRIQTQDSKERLNFKFHNFQGTAFFQTLKLLKDSSDKSSSSSNNLNSDSVTALELHIKVAEIMKRNNHYLPSSTATTTGQQIHPRLLVSDSGFSLGSSSLGGGVPDSSSISCGCSSHWDWTVLDTVIRWDLDKINKILYENDKFTQELFIQRECKDCFIGEWTISPQSGRKQRQISYILPLKSAFAKEVKCVEYVEVVIQEVVENASCNEAPSSTSSSNQQATCQRMVVETKVKSFDVPYADYFETFVRYCMTTDKAGSTRLLVTSTIHWTKWTALKSVIAKQTRQTLKETLGIVMGNLLRELKRRFPEFGRLNDAAEDDDEGDDEMESECLFLEAPLSRDDQTSMPFGVTANCSSKNNVAAAAIRGRRVSFNSDGLKGGGGQICFFSVPKALRRKTSFLFGSLFDVRNICLSFGMLVIAIWFFAVTFSWKGKSSFRGDSTVGCPMKLLSLAASNAFLYERPLQPISVLLPLLAPRYQYLVQVMENLKLLRQKNASSLLELLEMERKLSQALYDRHVGGGQSSLDAETAKGARKSENCAN